MYQFIINIIMIYILFLFFSTIQSSFGCPTSTTTTTTTTPETPEDHPIAVIQMILYGRGPQYSKCPKFFLHCKSIVMENLEEMLDIETEYFGFAVADDKRLNLKRRKTWKFDDGTWSPVHVTFFEDVTAWNSWGEGTCMYSQTGIRCTFLYHDRSQIFHKKIIWQPRPGVTILGTLPTGNMPSYHPSRSKNGAQRDDELDVIPRATSKPAHNYGYAKVDDALTWFYRNALNLDDKHKTLLEHGRSDNSTFADITVTIKYTTEFAQTLGVFYRHGLIMVAAWTIDTLNRVFENSRTLTKFRLRCMKLINDIQDAPNERLEVLEETKKVYEIITGTADDSGVGYQYLNQRFDARASNDIVIAYVHELSGFAGKALPYLMHLGTSGVVIRFDGLFDPYLLAHEVGHVLGAGHQVDTSRSTNAKMFFARGYKTPQSGFCTVMADAEACKSVPYYSSPNILHDALIFYVHGKPFSELKPPERLGTDLHNNAEWIKQNRFILQNVGNESMQCPKDRFSGFRIKPSIVDCITRQSHNSNFPCYRM